jgi:hypothetical protein
VVTKVDDVEEVVRLVRLRTTGECLTDGARPPFEAPGRHHRDLHDAPLDQVGGLGAIGPRAG